MTKEKNTLPPYEHLFTNKSLARAYDYINFIENVKLSTNSISCRVEGTYPYKVKISWNENDYTELSCTCPYDYDGYCKHIAAVLMYLKDEMDYMDKTDESTPHSAQNQKKPEWLEIVENLSKEELLSLIIEYAEDNEDLINTILVKYTQPSNDINIQKYKNIVDNIFDTFSEGYGFISYEDVYPITHLISNLLDNATSSKDNKHFNESFSISAAIAESCIYYIRNAEDSNGSIGGLINEAFDLVGDIFDECNDNNLRNLILEWLTEQMNNPDYSDYGCDDALSSIYFDLGSNEQYADSVLKFIDKQIDKYKNKDGWSATFRYEHFLSEKLALLSKLEKKDEVQSIIDNNLHVNDIRKVKVNQLLKQKEFSKAINCIKEGISISEQKNHYGTTANWNNLLLEIYESQGMIDELRKLAKAMIFDNSDMMKYYLLLKKHTESTKWNNERNLIINKLKSKQKPIFSYYSFSHNLASIYIEEEMWSELFLDVKKTNDISITSQYAEYLSNDFSAELIEIYKNSILKYAEKTGRKFYEDIKMYLREMSKLKGGLQSAKALKDELLNTYKNRPAMKKILNPLFR